MSQFLSAPIPPYSIKVYKEYFNFASSHFLIFPDGSREPLHEHNYRVRVQVETPYLRDDMVFDFLNIKPIIRRVCDSLDHKLLLPGTHPELKIATHDQFENNYLITTPMNDQFSIPKKDVLILPIPNTSAERLAIYLAYEVDKLLKKEFSFSFEQLMMEVEETPGQSATYILKREIPL